MTDEPTIAALLDREGRIRIDAFNRLSMVGMSRWLAEILLGQRLVTGADRDESSVDLLVRTYHRLDPWVRLTFHDVLLGLLDELARAPGMQNGAWSSVAAQHLLLLISSVFPGTPSVPAAIELLRCIVQAAPVAVLDHAVPIFALKALVALRHRAPPAFWLDQRARWGARSTAPVLRGMMHWDAGTAFLWIADNARDPDLSKALRAALPLLVERLGRGVIVEQLAKLAPRLPHEGRVALMDTCRALQLDQEAPVLGTDDAAHRVSAEIAVGPFQYQLDVQVLHDAGLSTISDPTQLRAQIAARLRDMDLILDPPLYLRALFQAGATFAEHEMRGVADRLLAWCASDTAVSDAKRHELIELFLDLERLHAVPALTYEINACLYLLRNRQPTFVADFTQFVAGLEA